VVRIEFAVLHLVRTNVGHRRPAEADAPPNEVTVPRSRNVCDALDSRDGGRLCDSDGHPDVLRLEAPAVKMPGRPSRSLTRRAT